MFALLFILLTLLQQVYSEEECMCTIVSSNIEESLCERVQQEDTPIDGIDTNEIAFDPKCEFVLATELVEPVYLSSIKKLIVSEPNTFIVEDVVIDSLEIKAEVSFVNFEGEGKLLINELIVEADATFEVIFSVDTTIKKSVNLFTARVELGVTLSINGSLDTLSIDGNLLLENGNVDEIVVTGRSELVLPKNVSVDQIALQTANFHLFVEDTVDVKINRYILDMNAEYINSISLIHSEKEISPAFYKELKIINTEEETVQGKISSECLDKELFFKAEGVEEVICHPIECIFEKNKRFNLPKCPYEEKKDKDSFTPTTLVLEGNAWEDKWSQKRFTNVIVDVGKDTQFDLDEKKINCENLIIRTGEVSLSNMNVENLYIERDVSIKLKNVTILSFIAEEDSSIYIEECTIMGYTDIVGATLKIATKLYFDKPKGKDDNYKVIFNSVALSLFDGLIVMEKSVEVYIEEMFVETDIFPLFGDNAKSKFYFGSTVSLNIEDDEFYRLGCIELVRVNDEGLIFLGDKTNVYVDENEIGAFVCYDDTEKPIAYIDCFIPKHNESPFTFSFEEDQIPKECKDLYSSTMSLTFEDEDVIFDYRDYYSVGKIKANKLTIKSDSWDEDQMLSIDFVEAEEVVIEEGCMIEDLTLTGKRSLIINSLFYIGSIYDNGNTILATIAIGSGASFELSGTTLNRVQMTILNGGSFFADSVDDDIVINQCEFTLEPEAVFWINSKSYVRNSNFTMSVMNDHALTFSDVSMKQVRILLKADEKSYNDEKEKIQYFIFSKNDRKLEEMFYGFIVGKAIFEITPQEECNGEWIMANKNVNDECPLTGVNVRGTEKFVIPQRWIKKSNRKIGYFIVPVVLIILVIMILKHFVKTKDSGRKQTNMTD